MHVAVLGQLAVSCEDQTLAGHQLGGRRVLVALAALALNEGPLTAERLAAAIWADQAPPTWPVAVRGVIGGLRSALAGIGAGGQRVIATTPAGYALAAGVSVDVRVLAAALREARELAAIGRHQATLDTVAPVAAASGEQLLPGEDADWLTPHRHELDNAALAAMELTAAAASGLGDHHRAIAAARRAVGARPLDEQAHRALIGALHRAGDRAGVVQAYEQCRSLLAEQLGVDPAPETARAYLAAIGEQPVAATARPPAATAAFFGRDDELARLATAIGEPGLVTVIGRGGVGKSRLVIQAVAGARELAGGRLWVSLAAVTRDELVASAVAVGIGVPPGADEVVSQLTGQLAPLGRALLVLDGCEAVIDGAASLAAALLAACPLLSIVVTSRVPLSVHGEQVIALAPLPDPVGDTAQALGASLSARLLADRVRAAGGRLDLNAATAPLVAELCRRCGGLPLALELVAAQLPVMSLADLLDHLPAIFADPGDRLRAIAASSYELLAADEALVFRLFGVLDGPVTVPLVRQVAGGLVAAPRVIRVLRELTARGLLAVDDSGPRWSYQQDDDLHAFAGELLVEAGEEQDAIGRLADAVSAVLPAAPAAPPAPYLDAVTEVLPSVRRLLGAAVDGDLDRSRGLELGFRLHRYWAATDVTEGRFWLSRLLAGRGQTAWTARASYALGYLSYWSGDAGAADAELRAAVQLASPPHGQPDEFAARALIYLGGLADDLDRGDEALDYVTASIAAAAPYGPSLQAGALIGMGCVLAERADPRAAGYAADAIALCRTAGSAEQLAATLPTAAMVCWQVGDLAGARGYIAEAQPLLAGERRIARVVLRSAAAGVALADGDTAAAIELSGGAAADAAELGIDRELPLARAITARAHLDRAGAGDLAVAAEQAAGAVRAAAALSFTSQLAVALEAAALVLLASAGLGPAGLGPARLGSGDLGSPGLAAAGAGPAPDRPGTSDRQPAGPADAADAADAARRLLDAAAAIRARGTRPGMPTLRAAVTAARAALAGSTLLADGTLLAEGSRPAVADPPLDPAVAGEFALAALSGAAGALRASSRP
ncbi:MAG TPA: BTAD domain-containing putative transcriptional regulator [Streptosporangiaceae bacterium]